MGYATGFNSQGREIGYAVKAICDLDECEEKIDRGIAHCCGGIDGTQNADLDGLPYCGRFVCRKHMTSSGICIECAQKSCNKFAPSEYQQERCPNCGFEDTRDAFEGWEEGGDFVVTCPRCGSHHPDQTDHDVEAAAS